MKNIICKKDGFTLYRPFNSWDMNYHLMEEATGTDYLIDIYSVYDCSEEAEYEGGLFWGEFCELMNIGEITDQAWKIIEGKV